MKNLFLLFALFVINVINLQAKPHKNLIFQPKSKNQQIIHHTYYSLSYVEKHEQAEWVYYQINIGDAKRSNNFREDKKVQTKSASLTDYKKSLYDRGHLAPAASMSINKTAMSESFLMSNMSPQTPSFNRGKWKSLEKLVRKWSKKDNTLHIVTGPIFSNTSKSIGKNKVTIPKYFYKIIYSPKYQKMIAFVLENKKLTKELQCYIVSVNFVENQTNIDFFPQLNDELENRLETISNLKLWNFN